MASAKDVACLKRELKKISTEFKKFRRKAAPMMKKAARGGVEGQEVHGGCSPCIAWTDI
ncbi:MAG: hypothetical protein NTZ92_00605 [Candidatus Omnitrophica bacterium]|nr:hypothetical protein [Candidatus Omnitrophota bacterium]